MTKIRAISPIAAMSGKLSRLDDIYFRTNTINGDIVAVKQRRFPLDNYAKQASDAQKQHNAAFVGLFKTVDTLLTLPIRTIYEDLYDQHIRACRQHRAISWDNKAVIAFLNAAEVIPEGISKTPEAIITELRSLRKPLTTLRNFVFHCLH